MEVFYGDSVGEISITLLITTFIYLAAIHLFIKYEGIEAR